MNMQQIGIALVVLLIAGGALIWFTNQETPDSMRKTDTEKSMQKDGAMMEDASKDVAMMKDASVDAMMEKDQAMMGKGTYEAYSGEKLSLAGPGKVILYFHADWCPICRPLDAALKSSSVPKGIHILKVNYDTATDLKQKYGVTYQHTFVQVDASGKMIAKWGDAFTAADVFARVK